MTYRKKPVEIEAFRLGHDFMPDWFMSEITKNNIVTMFKNNYEPESPFEDCSKLIEADIKTLEGTMRANNGDYIIKGVKGEIYPCKPDIFEATYEKVIKDTKMNTDEMIEVMQAYARGEAIEVSGKGADDWSEIKHPLWDWNSFEYRVRPQAFEMLWYWEFKMSDGWHISQTRMTRVQARAFVGDNVEIAQLYALGFRIKDEK